MTKEKMTILNLNVNPDKLFFGESGHGISRYDVIRYPILDKIDEKMKSFYWNPKEVDLGQEKRSFSSMTDIEQFVFTSNLKRQILLDSIQGRAPTLAFLPHCTDPTLENCLTTWSFFETIHSQSYTHIIRAIYPDPKVVIDDMPNILQIVECANDITKSYDALTKNPNKENLYLALIAANALESIRFFVSFACSFSFLERALVEGSAKIIKLIARDENVHLSLVQHLLKLLPQDDPEFVQIIGDNREKAKNIFITAVDQEKEWGEYLFKDGSILGLNSGILSSYGDHLLGKQLKANNLTSNTEKFANPIPWISKHLSSAASAPAPQEVEISSYLMGSIKNNLSDLDMSNLM
jgi:ribonucleoside-diphosphate reductase beta chain